MSFDIPELHIADNSPEARAIELVMQSEHVDSRQAVLSILRRADTSRPERNFIKEGRGLFKDPEEAKVLDEAVAIALEERRRPSNQTVA